MGYVSIDVINDLLVEPDETIIIELIKPLNANLGEKVTYLYEIINDDSAPTITNVIPRNTFPVKGTKESKRCSGFNRYQYFHDGLGGTYARLIERNSISCGYKKPTIPIKSSYYNRVWNRESHDRRTKPNSDGYFITIKDNGPRKATLKVWNKSSNIKINEYIIIGKIDNIYYSNQVFYTNKDRPLDHHIIDIKTKENSYLGTRKLTKKRLSFQKTGSSNENEIIFN